MKYLSPETAAMVKKLEEERIHPLLTIGYKITEVIDEQNMKFEMVYTVNPALKGIKHFNQGILYILKELVEYYENPTSDKKLS